MAPYQPLLRDITVSITFLRPRELLRNIGLLALLGVTVACQPRADVTTVYSYTVIGERAHNTRLFTQGLLLRDDIFYESGEIGRASCRVRVGRCDVDLGT